MSAIASSSHCDRDSGSLQVLLEAFGSRFSVEDIATAYCQASCNVDTAGEILFAMTENMPKDEEVDMNGTISAPTSGNVLQELCQEDRKAKVLKPKKSSVSVGTVASVIGKDYVRTRPLTNGPREATKPVKIDSKDILATEIWSKEMPENTKAENDKMQTDVEEFLLKMLGEGFKANPGMIHEVLGMCGYDVQKSVEKLLDLSDTEKYAGAGVSTEMLSKEGLEKQGSISNLKEQPQDSTQSNAAGLTTGNLMGSQKGGKDKTDLEREVLQALFSGAERFEEEAEVTRPVRERKSRASGRPVLRPLDEPFQESVVVVRPPAQTPKEDEDDENSFEALRKAAIEHWITKKEYYKAAVEAFVKGEIERADRLLEKGHFFRQKAREADEKSTAKLLELKNDIEPAYSEEEVLTLNVHDLQAKEALRLLKLHLTSFSGISSFKYLRVIVGVKEEDIRSARKRVIAKLLEKESIVWCEEDNGLKMMVRVDEIDPKSLSFAKK